MEGMHFLGMDTPRSPAVIIRWIRSDYAFGTVAMEDTRSPAAGSSAAGAGGNVTSGQGRVTDSIPYLEDLAGVFQNGLAPLTSLSSSCLPKCHLPRRESALMCPTAPASTNVLPQKDASRRARWNFMYGSFRLATSIDRNGNCPTGAGAKGNRRASMG